MGRESSAWAQLCRPEGGGGAVEVLAVRGWYGGRVCASRGSGAEGEAGQAGQQGWDYAKEPHQLLASVLDVSSPSM